MRERERTYFDVTLRLVPGHHWARLVCTTRSTMAPGHDWLYHGLVRRDAWRLGPFGLALLRLPRARPTSEHSGHERVNAEADPCPGSRSGR